MTPSPRAGFALCAAGLFGCAGGGPQPRVDTVEPAQAYTDRNIRLMLTGEGFVPSFRLDPESGERVATVEGFSGRVGKEPVWEPLTDFGWVGPTKISAGMAKEDAEDLPFGLCDVEITDPRGHKAVLIDGFFALGPDPPPVVIVARPEFGELFAPGSTIHARVTAADQPPGHLTALTWTYTETEAAGGTQRNPVTGVCPFEPGSSSVDCVFDVTISLGMDAGATVNLSVAALDDAVPPNQASPDIPPILLSSRPTVSSVMPRAGGTAGGTDVVIQGSGFLPGTRVYFGNSLLIPNGGLVVDPQTISGYAPAHPAGSASVTVQSPLGLATWSKSFEYQSPPQIASIFPSDGSRQEDTPVEVSGSNFSEATIIYLGQTLAAAVRLEYQSFFDDTKITGVVPRPNGLAWAWVWAFDANNGWTRLPDRFSWIAP